jgi:hypothetical protein
MARVRSTANVRLARPTRGGRGNHRQIGAGEIYLVEDLYGKGHLSRGLVSRGFGQFRRSLLIPTD